MNKNLNHPIDRVFSFNPGERGGVKLMTHVVAGYPDLETNERLIKVMAESGADMIEVQIPFSDPLADGATIATANQAALEKGITPGDCFGLVERLRKQVDIPLLIMTYANIPFRVGIETFARQCSVAGVSGIIIPDWPFAEALDMIDMMEAVGLYVIPVVSPGMSEERLTKVCGGARGFIYATLRVGITGARGQLEEKGLNFLRALREYSSLPIAAGFGISSVDMVRQIEALAVVDAVVIGSRIIDLVEREGIEAVGQWLGKLKKCTDPWTGFKL